MPKKRPLLPPIPASFTVKKNKILSSLAQPLDVYTDASPKGSVDAPIRDLIDRINAVEGYVTTSSCSGRISVFAEGQKSVKVPSSEAKQQDEDSRMTTNGTELREEGSVQEQREATQNVETAKKSQKVTPGGKGAGGKWLFVSHNPLEKDFDVKRLGLIDPTLRAMSTGKAYSTNQRHVRFAFEPMILHIMTASLHHAQTLLAAAINAGFRESGVQSLKNLVDDTAYPMVAVRSTGLAFESLVGVIDNPENDDGKECEEGEATDSVRSLVDEQCLNILVGIANERFQANSERTARFGAELFGHGVSQNGRLS